MTLGRSPRCVGGVMSPLPRSRRRHRGGGRGFYFKDPNGHLLEVLTV
jgi:hypothetical protein